MNVVSVEPTIVSIPERDLSGSAKGAEKRLTSVLVKVTTDSGVIGWGEACSGAFADPDAVEAAVRSMARFVVERDPWDHPQIRKDVLYRGSWQFRTRMMDYIWTGIEIALWDICSRSVDQPLYRLLGGLRREEATYYYPLYARTRELPGALDDLRAECKAAVEAGYDVIDAKIGWRPFQQDLATVKAIRDALGPSPRLRLDINRGWGIREAIRNLRVFEQFDIDFVEQPVHETPPQALEEVRGAVPMKVAANEALFGGEATVHERIVGRHADVYCFSPYHVGSLSTFQRLCYTAALEQAEVCKHTHGELGIAATAFHHVLLTIPNGVDGHQQNHTDLAHDVLRQPLPIETGPRWGVPEGPGLGVEIDEAAIQEAARRYRTEGPVLPFWPEMGEWGPR